MPYSINLSKSKIYFSLSYTGKVDFEELKQSRAEVSDQLKSTDLNRLLVDVRGITNKIDTLEHYEFTSSHIDVLPGKARIAVLIREEVLKDSKFVESIALNHGIQMKIFTVKNEALRWLMREI